MKKTTARKGKTAKKPITKKRKVPTVTVPWGEKCGVEMHGAEGTMQVFRDVPATLANIAKALEWMRQEAMEHGNAAANRFNKLRDDVNDAVGRLFDSLADTDRKAASLEALNEVKARVDALELTARNHADVFGDRCDRLAAIEDKLGIGVSPIREPAHAPVDVAALCQRHGLKQCNEIHWRSTPDGNHPVSDTEPYLYVHHAGSWYFHGKGKWLPPTQSGNTDTLAAALERYCPLPVGYSPNKPAESMVMDAPYYGEAERRADAIAAGWKQSGFSDGTFYPVLIEHNTPAIDDVAGAHVRSGTIRHPHSMWGQATPAEFKAHLAKYAVKREPVKPATAEERAALCEKWDAGDVIDRLPTSLTAAELESELRACLPYDREWREKAAKAEGWKKCISFVYSGDLYAPPNGRGVETAVDPSGVLFELNKMPVQAPDRALWLAFIREHTPKREPDATPEERRAECEARGLKLNAKEGGIERYTSDGFGTGAGAWTSGRVHHYGNNGQPIFTRTLPEFRAALDAVGLVKVALVGPGPWAVEQLNAAGVKCHRGGGSVVHLDGASTRKDSCGHASIHVDIATRAHLLHAVAHPDASPEWAAKVRKALGVRE